MRRRTVLKALGILSASPYLGEPRSLARSPFPPPRQFRLGVISDELSQDLEEALKITKAHGLDWVELRTLWGKYNTETSPQEVQRVKDLLGRYGSRVSVVDTALYKCDLPGTKNVVGEKDAYPYAGQMDLLKRALERAHAFGTDRVRVFAFWRTAKPAEHFPHIADQLAHASDVAGAAKIRLVLENEGSCNVGSGRELAAMLKLVPAANFGANWDIGNGYWHGEVSYPAGYSMIPKDRIWHMHLKDVRCGRTAAAQQKSEAWRLKGGQQSEKSACHTAIVGTGQVDLAGQLRAALENHYDGTMSLEPEYEATGVSHQQATTRSLENLLKIMAKSSAA
jgi:L-ribulose-5-phosphate 3-epimerase